MFPFLGGGGSIRATGANLVSREIQVDLQVIAQQVCDTPRQNRRRQGSASFLLKCSEDTQTNFFLLSKKAGCDKGVTP